MHANMSSFAAVKLLETRRVLLVASNAPSCKFLPENNLCPPPLMLVRLCLQPPKTRNRSYSKPWTPSTPGVSRRTFPATSAQVCMPQESTLDVRDQVCDLLHVIGVVMMTVKQPD